MRKEILFGGYGGQGILLMGYTTGLAAAVYEGLESSYAPSYGPEARGGSACSKVTIADEKIVYPLVSEPEYMVIMSKEAYHKYIPMLKKGGYLFYDRDLVDIDEQAKKAKKIYAICATRIAESLGYRIVANMVMLGFFTSISEILKLSSVEKAMLSRVPQKYAEINKTALKEGHKRGEEAKSH